MPAGFRWPNGAQVWVLSQKPVPPSPIDKGDLPTTRDVRYFEAVAKLKDGVSFNDAQNDMQDLGTAQGPSDSLRGSIHVTDWHGVGGGEAGHVVSDPSDPNIVYAGEYLGIITRYDDRTGESRNVSAWPENPSGHGGEDMNCWRFDSRIFGACRDVPRSVRGEFELPEAVGLAVRRGVPFRAIPAVGPVLDLSRRADTTDVATRLVGIVPEP